MARTVWKKFVQIQILKVILLSTVNKEIFFFNSAEVTKVKSIELRAQYCCMLFFKIVVYCFM